MGDHAHRRIGQAQLQQVGDELRAGASDLVDREGARIGNVMSRDNAASSRGDVDAAAEDVVAGDNIDVAVAEGRQRAGRQRVAARSVRCRQRVRRNDGNIRDVAPGVEGDIAAAQGADPFIEKLRVDGGESVVTDRAGAPRLVEAADPRRGGGYIGNISRKISIAAAEDIGPGRNIDVTAALEIDSNRPQGHPARSTARSRYRRRKRPCC